LNDFAVELIKYATECTQEFELGDFTHFSAPTPLLVLIFILESVQAKASVYYVLYLQLKLRLYLNPFHHPTTKEKEIQHVAKLLRKCFDSISIPIKNMTMAIVLGSKLDFDDCPSAH